MRLFVTFRGENEASVYVCDAKSFAQACEIALEHLTSDWSRYSQTLYGCQSERGVAWGTLRTRPSPLGFTLSHERTCKLRLQVNSEGLDSCCLKFKTTYTSF